MLSKLSSWHIDAQRRKTRTRSVILLSLILHMVLVIAYLFIPMNKLSEEQTDALTIDLIKDAAAPKKRKDRPKPPLTKKLYDPSQQLARDAMEKKIEAAPNKQDEVVKLSQRVVLEDVEVNNAPLSEVIPDLMTDAQLRDAEASNLSHLVAQPGRTDVGRFRGDGQGGGDRLLGGGGNDGIADRLGLIDFLNEFGAPKNVVYCLDVSASMQVGGLNKLELAVKSIKDSVLMLRSDDMLNVVSFSPTARAMHKKMLPANASNIERTLKYLDSFTPEKIQDNSGTNILAALEASLMLDASVIVLVTDGLPSLGIGHDDIERNTQQILDTVREQNLNKAIIYVVALEIDLKRSPGAQLLVSLAEEHNGKVKEINGDLLREYAELEGLPE